MCFDANDRLQNGNFSPSFNPSFGDANVSPTLSIGGSQGCVHNADPAPDLVPAWKSPVLLSSTFTSRGSDIVIMRERVVLSTIVVGRSPAACHEAYASVLECSSAVQHLV
jgi:hypothetical protein